MNFGHLMRRANSLEKTLMLGKIEGRRIRGWQRTDELWTEVRDIVQETGTKTIPMEEKCKKAKWLSGEALQIVVKSREAKSKGKKEIYKHLNAELNI